MAITYTPNESGSTPIPFSSGVEQSGLVNKPSEGGSFNNESVGDYASATTSANAAKLAQTAAELAETNAEASEVAALASQTAAANSEIDAQSSEDDAAVSEVNASNSATSSASSATASSTSASGAATSETNAAASKVAALASQTAAATSETNAATSATQASGSATAASGSATVAAASAAAALVSENNSATSETNAATSETNAASSESNALSSKNASATSASNASTSESNASTSASTATTKATQASTSETNAATSATAAALSATAAQTAETAAELAETNAETAETAAELAETHAETAEAAAVVSQTAAAASQASATASAASATTSAAGAASSATDAQSSEDDAATSETNAANSATASASSATASSSSATNAATSATAAATSATSSAASLTTFQGQYVSQATSPSSPTTGDLWFDETASVMKVYNGSAFANAGSSVNGVENSVEHTATAGQTTFTATYDAGFLQVFLNGIRLDAADYTATNGTSVVLGVAAALNDVIFIHSFGTFQLADHYTKSVADATFQAYDADTAKTDVAQTFTADQSHGDNVRAKFGNSDDLQIYHAGTHSYVRDEGTGGLILTSNGPAIYMQKGDSETIAEFGVDGAVKLRHDNVQKFATTSTGVDVTGTVSLNDSDSRVYLSNVGTDNAGIYVRGIGASSTLRNHSTGIHTWEVTGSEKMRISAAGNVGIGTSSPSSALEVNSGTANTVATFKSTDAYALIKFEDSGTSTEMTMGAKDGDMVFRVNASEAIRIDSSGNVGIGTSTPSAALHAKGGSISTPADASAFLANATARLVVNHGNEYGAYVGYANSTNDAIGIQSAKSIGQTGPLSLNPYGGNVGIGTSSPSSALDVAGTVTAAGLVVDGASSSQQITFSRTVSSTGTGKIGSDVSQAMGLWGTDGTKVATFSQNKDISFYEDTGTTAKFFWDASAESLGIGTSSPTAILDVRRGDASGKIAEFHNSTGYGVEIGSSQSEAYIQSGNLQALVLGSHNTERMRIDSSGNVLVGTTSSAPTTGSGFAVQNTGRVFASFDGGYTASLNRSTSDGEILRFRKDGTTVGSIGVASGELFLGSNAGSDAFNIYAGASGHKGLRLGAGFIAPTSNSTSVEDNTTDLGISTARFRNLYLSGGIQLGGTGAANKLDEYEEGTWSPVPLATHNAHLWSVASYSNGSGQYTRIGNVVTFHFQVTIDSTSGSSITNLGINGLPFAAGTTRHSVGNARSQDTGSLYNLESISGSQIGVIRKYDNGNWASGATLPVTFVGTGTYII